MSKSMNEDQRIQNMIRFVKATQELIDEISIENVSIRKIATRAGFHNSTIYLYFKDVDYLILLASMRYFEEYSRSLAELSTKNLSTIDSFFAVWTYFCNAAFAHPNLFYSFFFGKYSDNLTPIINLYYRLFPEEKPAYTQEIEEMYFGGNISDRCLQILKPLAEVESTLVTGENLQLVNTITVACLKQLLDQACANPAMDPDDINDQLIQMICHVAGVE